MTDLVDESFMREQARRRHGGCGCVSFLFGLGIIAAAIWGYHHIHQPHGDKAACRAAYGVTFNAAKMLNQLTAQEITYEEAEAKLLSESHALHSAAERTSGTSAVGTAIQGLSDQLARLRVEYIDKLNVDQSALPIAVNNAETSCAPLDSRWVRPG